MEIINLKLLNFRSYDSLDLKFSPRLNIIYGNNGMGKTNLIEAIYILGLTKSFRAGLENVVIKHGKNIAKIEGTIRNNIIHNYKIIISDVCKRIKIDNTKITKISDYLSKINIVLFEPDNLKMIKDTPMTRRKLLNIDILCFNSTYLINLTNYNKVLKQRNAYLKALGKKNKESSNFLDVLTEQLIDLGLKIVEERSKYLNEINCYIDDIYYDITHKGHLKIRYKSDFLNKTKDTIMSMYEKNIYREIIMGKTFFGPHHDDFEFIVDNNPVKVYSSVGEQKNSVISYKLSQIRYIKNNLGNKPILILDDLFSELDNEKINNIIDLIDNDLQTFITTTDISNVEDKLLKQAKIFHVKDGLVIEEEK